MRWSRPMPRATSRMSAPTLSASRASSLMKLILRARKALAPYLMSSAEARSVVRKGTALMPSGLGRKGGGVKLCSRMGS